MTALTDMTPEEAFSWIRERAPSAGQVTYAIDATSRMRTIYLERATLADARRLRTALGIMAPLAGPFAVKITGRPRIYKRGGEWWVNCKHGNRTGPYSHARSAFFAARYIWQEPSDSRDCYADRVASADHRRRMALRGISDA